MQVGTTKDQGLYNKPSTAVHPGALAAGTIPQYNTIQSAPEETVELGSVTASEICRRLKRLFLIMALRTVSLYHVLVSKL